MSAPAVNLVEVTRDPALAQLEENRVRRKARIGRPRWSPKSWHPVYEEVVLLDALGYKNTAIAEMKGFTKEHISNILCTPQAKIIKELVLKQMEKKREETIEQRMDRLAHRAMDRIEQVIDNDDLALKQPLSIFDRAIVVLKGANKIKDKENEAVEKKSIMVSEEAMDKLLSAIAKSDKVRELHSGIKPGIPVNGKVIDVGSDSDS